MVTVGVSVVTLTSWEQMSGAWGIFWGVGNILVNALYLVGVKKDQVDLAMTPPQLLWNQVGYVMSFITVRS